MAGMPPLSGFLGKLMVLDGVRAEPWVWTIWAVVIVTSLMMVVGFARAGSALFWGGAPDPEAPAPEGPPRAALPAGPLLAPGYLLALLAALTVMAAPVTGYLEATAAQLYAIDAYFAATHVAVAP
jgi:multicomponent K+:H+ antiporter subunit D